jgi:hypothetical protein
LSRQRIQSFQFPHLYLLPPDDYSEVIALQEQNDDHRQQQFLPPGHFLNWHQENTMNFAQVIADLVTSLFDAAPELEGRRRHFAKIGFGGFGHTHH